MQARYHEHPVLSYCIIYWEGLKNAKGYFSEKSHFRTTLAKNGWQFTQTNQTLIYHSIYSWNWQMLQCYKTYENAVFLDAEHIFKSTECLKDYSWMLPHCLIPNLRSLTSWSHSTFVLNNTIVVLSSAFIILGSVSDMKLTEISK